MVCQHVVLMTLVHKCVIYRLSLTFHLICQTFLANQNMNHFWHKVSCMFALNMFAEHLWHMTVQLTLILSFILCHWL